MAKLNKLFLSRNFLDCVVPKIQAVTVLRQSAPSARCHWHSRSHLIGWKLWSLVSRKLRTLEKISKGHFCSASNHLSVLHISHRFCNIIYKFIVCQLKEKNCSRFQTHVKRSTRFSWEIIYREFFSSFVRMMYIRRLTGAIDTWKFIIEKSIFSSLPEQN